MAREILKNKLCTINYVHVIIKSMKNWQNVCLPFVKIISSLQSNMVMDT